MGIPFKYFNTTKTLFYDSRFCNEILTYTYEFIKLIIFWRGNDKFNKYLTTYLYVIMKCDVYLRQIHYYGKSKIRFI
jgi:hypothetical protein